MRYIVVAQHRSEYPQPVCFAKGNLIAIGEKYEGPEGWVPGQIIEQLNPGNGKALEDYTALELNVDEGDVLIGTRTLNGWVWSHYPPDTRSGWVPLENLQVIDND